MAQLSDEQANEYWSQLGFQPQCFPYYYNQSASTFDDPPGAIAGAEITIPFSLDNFPHMLEGIRVRSTWQGPDNPDADELALMTYVKKYVDEEQSLRLELTQQSIIAKAVPQVSVQGNDGFVWHAFPTPFPMAGGNTVNVVIKRLTSYPFLSEQRINPRVDVTLVCRMLRADRLTSIPLRVGNR